MAKKNFVVKLPIALSSGDSDLDKNNGRYDLLLNVKAGSYKNAADKLEAALQRLLDSMEK